MNQAPALHRHDAVEPTLLFRAATVAALVPLLARLRLPRLEALIEPRRSPGRLGRGEETLTFERVDRAVAIAMQRGAPFVRPGCLTRGVARYWLLRRAGIDVSLCFGVGQVAGAIESHCWIELRGAVMLELADPLVTFGEIARIPGVATRG